MAKTNADIYKELADLRTELRDRENHLEEKIDQTYLRIQVFESEIRPIRKFVYGIVTIVGGAVLTAVVGVVVATQ